MPDAPNTSLSCVTRNSIEALRTSGFFVICDNTLRGALSTAEYGAYVARVLAYRDKMRIFFELPLRDREAFTAIPEKDEQTHVFPCGYWPPSVYVDKHEGVDFHVEYYFSREHSLANVLDMCRPSQFDDCFKSGHIPLMPHAEAYWLGGTINSLVFNPLAQRLHEVCAVSIPAIAFQMSAVYYRRAGLLSPHRDKSFFTLLIGPLQGLNVDSYTHNKTIEVRLGIGEILVYTGFAFQETVPDAEIAPILHSVNAYEGRLTSAVNSFPC